jgi:hypothetical protein
MAKAAKKNQADLREPVAAQQRELDALRAKVEGTPEAGKAPPEAPDEPRSQHENDDQSELATLKARLAELEAKEKGVVAPIEIDIEVLKSVRAMTEKDAQQIIEQTKRVKINVVDEITLKDVTPKNQRITVPAPTNLGEGLLVIIDLINKDGGKIITLAYDVKTNAQGLYLELRDAASQKKFRQQEK